MSTSIEWTDETWNPLRGCRRISPGCENCYAERQAARPILSGPGQPYEGLVRIGKGGPRWTGETAGPDKLDAPLRWKKPRRVFPCSMSDLFFEGHTDEQIAQVFAVMALARQHTFQALTKRAARALAWLTRDTCEAQVRHHADEIERRVFGRMADRPAWTWPLPNLHIGFSAEDQARFDERWAVARGMPAAVLMVSLEPLLGPVVLPADFLALGRRAWVIIGGESGPGARPFHVAWMRSVVRQCRPADVPAFCKQVGANVRDRNDAGFDGEEGDAWDFGSTFPDDVIEHDPDGYRQEYQGAPVRIRLRDRKGGDMDEWPADLRVREFPRAP